MSKDIFKKQYKCDCGVIMGDCGADCAVILVVDHSTDVYTLFHTDSHYYNGNNTVPKTTNETLSSFTDAYFDALKIVMNLDETDKLTEIEKTAINDHFK